MGLFSWASDAWHGVTHAASSAWHGVEDGARDAGDFFAHRWKTFAGIAVGTVAFVTVATLAPELLPGLIAAAPEVAPWLVLGAAGATSGAASRTVLDLLDGRRPGLDVLRSAAITGVLSVATVGVLQWAAPQLGQAIPLLRPLTDRFAADGLQAGEAALSGRAAAEAAAAGRVAPEEASPLEAAEPTAPAAALARAGDATTDEAPEDGETYKPMTARQAAARAPKFHGIIGILTGDAGTTSKKDPDEESGDGGP
jgi:hypothetical protein